MWNFSDQCLSHAKSKQNSIGPNYNSTHKIMEVVVFYRIVLQSLFPFSNVISFQTDQYISDKVINVSQSQSSFQIKVIRFSYIQLQRMTLLKGDFHCYLSNIKATENLNSPLKNG